VDAHGAKCVIAVLTDPHRRVAALHGRLESPRALGSVHGGAITRFLDAGFRGRLERTLTLDTLGFGCVAAMAVTLDGATLLVTFHLGGVAAFRACDGAFVRAIHTREYNMATDQGKRRPLVFCRPWALCVAPDGVVYVADNGCGCVQILSPELDFERFLCDHELPRPSNVCATASVVAVAICHAQRIDLFCRKRRRLLRHVMTQPMFPASICVTPTGDIAVVKRDRHYRYSDGLRVLDDERLWLWPGSVHYELGDTAFTASGTLLYTDHTGFFALDTYGAAVKIRSIGMHGRGVLATCGNRAYVRDYRNVRVFVFV
jgi:hypothetical protein